LLGGKRSIVAVESTSHLYYSEMKYLPIIGLTVALVCYADLAVAKTPKEIELIAKAVTVEIILLKDESVGSGIIIERKGDLYTLITNRHVACGKKRECTSPLAAETYTLKLGDGQQYKVATKSVKILGGNLDLAIIQFQSDRGYPVAQIAEPGSLKVGDKVFTSGYPATPPGFSFNAGKAIAVVDKRLTEDRGGYTVIYDAQTQPGMSGGGVFSQEGQLVAIHGQGERFRANTQLETVSSSGYVNFKQEVGSKIGYNRGIPVRWVVKGLAERGIRVGNRQPLNLEQTAASSADEHFIAGFNRWVEPGADVVAGKRLAIDELSQAIGINPRYTSAYFIRAGIYAQLQGGQQALADYDRVIAIDPKFIPAYNNRALLKADELNDLQGALADYERAIALEPRFADIYSNRGVLKKDKLNDVRGALADYDRAIALNPKFANTYYNRALLKSDKLNNFRGALADYNRAIALNPEYVIAYSNRGALKYQQLNDFQGALADFDRVISLDPKYAIAYSNRGLLKLDKFNDFQGALADYNRAISLDSKYAIAYSNRGLLKLDKFNDSQGALADFNRAISLNPKYVNAYFNRGNLKAEKLNDFRGAIADFDRVIELNPQSAKPYGIRGYLKYTNLGDRPGGIADLRQVAKLARAQGNSRLLQFALQTLQSWGMGE
jgi:tetratricopeptide (TPR) repeat protein